MQGPWVSCDGHGQTPGSTSSRPDTHQEHPGERASSEGDLDRRTLISRFAMAALGGLLMPSALAQVAFQPNRRTENVLVFLFLRGGADGLSLVTPYREDEYFRLRPATKIVAPRPGSNLDLDGQFALHPGLADLIPLYREGDLALIQAVGSQDQTRSHFEAMATIEQGTSTSSGRGAGGWLARYLNSTRSASDSPLRAVSFGDTLPDSLRGSPQATRLNDLDDLRLTSAGAREQAIRKNLEALYRSSSDEVAVAGLQTLQVLNQIEQLSSAQAPRTSEAYPNSPLGRGLRDTARLIRASAGLEVACLDLGGWDTHVVQGTLGGAFEGLARDLGTSLAAFARDLGPEIKKVTVVVMTEFGRRVYENSGLGTDHGRASIAMVLGQRVQGGRVAGEWPTLAADRLEEPGDLRVTTDYRSILAEVLTKKFGVSDLSRIFPDFSPSPLGLLA